MEACFKAIVEQGGHPLLRLEVPGLHEFFLEQASEAQLSHLPPEALFEAEKVAGRIRIAAESDTHSMSRVDPLRQAMYDRAETRSARPRGMDGGC